MAKSSPINVKVDVRFDAKYPKVPSTITERINALRVSKELVTGGGNSIAGQLFGNQTQAVRQSAEGVLTLLRLAEYITTGHDYFDTHPTPAPETKLSKKERRKRSKEIRKLVQQEVEEELDARQKAGAGKLVMPRVLIQEEDGSLTDTAPEDKPAEWWMPTPEEKADAERRDNHDDN